MTEIDDLLARIHEIPGCEMTKRRVLAVLASMTGRRLCFAYRSLVLPSRVRLAADLLEAHLTTAEAAAALVERLGVSRRTAQRLVWKARQQRGERATMRQLGMPWP